MKDEIVTAILQEMTPVLDQEQLTRLKSVVRVQLCGYDISKKETGLMCADQNGHNYLRVFLDTFRQNGKSEGTIFAGSLMTSWYWGKAIKSGRCILTLGHICT